MTIGIASYMPLYNKVNKNRRVEKTNKTIKERAVKSDNKDEHETRDGKR